MGQRNAAAACQRATSALAWVHRNRGFGLENYLDDMIGVERKDRSLLAYDELGVLLTKLGLEEKLSKACPPATEQMVLGIEINTERMTLRISDTRMGEIKGLLNEWDSKIMATLKELQSLIGKLAFISKCVLSSRVFMNRLLRTLRAASNDSPISLSVEFRKDIRWWRKFAEQYNGISIIPNNFVYDPDVVFATDSCLSGCGGVTKSHFFHREFPSNIIELELDINCLELLAIFLCLRLWAHQWKGSRLQIFCDNQTAVLAINSGRALNTPFIAHILRNIWWIASNFQLNLRAVHLSGVDNRLPDYLSRWHLDPKYEKLFYESTEAGRFEEVIVLDEDFKFVFDG